MMETGLTYTSTVVVSKENVAATMGSGDLNVFATPAMVALMENAAMSAVADELPEGSTTVGAMMNTTHIKPSAARLFGKAVVAQFGNSKAAALRCWQCAGQRDTRLCAVHPHQPGCVCRKRQDIQCKGVLRICHVLTSFSCNSFKVQYTANRGRLSRAEKRKGAAARRCAGAAAPLRRQKKA